METIMRALIVIHIPTREFPANSATSHSMIVTDSAKLRSVSWKMALATGGGELRQRRPWLLRRQTATATSSISGSPMIDCDEIGGACNSSPPTDARTRTAAQVVQMRWTSRVVGRGQKVFIHFNSVTEPFKHLFSISPG